MRQRGTQSAFLREENDRLREEKDAHTLESAQALRREKAEQERLKAECRQLQHEKRALERELVETEHLIEKMVRGTVDQNFGHMKLITQQLQEYLDVLNHVCRSVGQARNEAEQPVIALPEDLDAWPDVEEDAQVR